MSGANLLLVLIDRAVYLDAEGKPTTPPNSRHTALVGLGKQESGDAVRLYVYRLYSSDAAPNPYGNSVTAEVSRANSAEGPADQGRLKKESWRIMPEGGGELEITLSYLTGQQAWAPGELNPYSNTDLGFSRIYRHEQLVDLAMSVPAGKKLEGEFSFSCTIPELSDVFDGSEEVTAILDIPVYVREIYLP
ncbi:MAG: hypothetical protein GY798_14865 [Hyphomicrobiales bacterium]|nr:hypothetical protein [Hyphomicrobiales bacterium]